jgi:hypothetical protein
VPRRVLVLTAVLLVVMLSASKVLAQSARDEAAQGVDKTTSVQALDNADFDNGADSDGLPTRPTRPVRPTEPVRPTLPVRPTRPVRPTSPAVPVPPLPKPPFGR